LQTTTGVFVTIHGHFYQPPRENPYLDAIERQAGAAPFHNWNERIHAECYRPNAFARILNDRGEVAGIINNYEYMSFNIGPTLMTWLERHDFQTYQRILEADRKSSLRLNGHGNAIAQVYNHMIMPLANERDKYTQIRWGKADFRDRFGRDPEGMWLAETAVDYDTLAALIAEGIHFIILAPSQAQRCRPFPTAEQPDPVWHEIGGSQIDPTRPYRCFVQAERRQKAEGRRQKGKGRRQRAEGRGQKGKGAEVEAGVLEAEVRDYIDLFFYDGPISRDMGFNDVLSDSQHLTGRIGQAVRGDHRPAQLIAVATDGETFGHHKQDKEKTLAYALTHEFPQWGWTVTNFAHYLSLHPPTWEVELKPVTAWSCAHGVDRWQDDCGCGGDGGHWHQRWRRPLREALNWLRDQLIPIYETHGQQLFYDPWHARDAYIQVIRDRSPETVERFFAEQCHHALSAAERIDALRLLEMQRHALLMFTSCGWFFEELSRPEGVQILRYAARAIELAAEVSETQLEPSFLQRLALAPSNVDCFNNGAEVYRQLVTPSQLTIEQVTAHYAISSLLTTYPSSYQLYCYTVQQLDYQLQRMGTLALAVGQLQITSEITGETNTLVFAVLHLGGWDFHCCIQPFAGRRQYRHMQERLMQSLQQASAAYTIGVMNQAFNSSGTSHPEIYTLHNLFSEERQRLMQLLTQETLSRLNHLYAQVYRDNYGVLMACHRGQMEVPHALQVAADIALEQRVLQILASLEQELSDPSAGPSPQVLVALKELKGAATEVEHLRGRLDSQGVREILQRLIERSLYYLLHLSDLDAIREMGKCVEQLLESADQLNLNLGLERAQELYCQRFPSFVQPLLLAYQHQMHQHSMETSATEVVGSAPPESPNHELLHKNPSHQLLRLGQLLHIDVQAWLDRVNSA
jgi:alpha-amylase/alpha-mannosidase (GH57 family)